MDFFFMSSSLNFKRIFPFLPRKQLDSDDALIRARFAKLGFKLYSGCAYGDVEFALEARIFSMCL
jgi:hypothetical protein